MRVLSTVKFTALRMVRNYIVLLLLLVVPIFLITFFSFILSGHVTEAGVPYIYQNALTLILVFQLFGGSIVMYLIHHDLFAENRMRMYALPINSTMYAFSIMACGAVYSIALGVTLMAYTQFVLGVTWKHWPWMIYVIALLAALSIIVSLIFTFSVKKFNVASRLSELYGVGFILLAGLFFPMPDHAFFKFMGSFGNPIGLSMLAIDAMNQADAGTAWMYANILLAVSGTLFIMLLLVGRRKMA